MRAIIANFLPQVAVPVVKSYNFYFVNKSIRIYLDLLLVSRVGRVAIVHWGWINRNWLRIKASRGRLSVRACLRIARLDYNWMMHRRYWMIHCLLSKDCGLTDCYYWHLNSFSIPEFVIPFSLYTANNTCNYSISILQYKKCDSNYYANYLTNSICCFVFALVVTFTVPRFAFIAN